MRSQPSVLTGKNPAKRVQTDRETGGGKGKMTERGTGKGKMTERETGKGNDTILEGRFTLNIY